MPLSDHLREKKALRRKRVARCEQLILQGCTKLSDLSVVLGVSRPTVSKYIKLIEERWLESGPQSAELKRARAIGRLDQVAFAALQGFARSQENEETVSTQHKQVSCKNCNGTGADGECEVCEGVGHSIQETQMRTVKGKAGDSSFLQVARQCFSDISKLEGTAPKEGAGAINVSIVNTDSLNKYKALPPEELIRLKQIHHNALRTPAIAPAEPTDAEIVIDLKSEDTP